MKSKNDNDKKNIISVFSKSDQAYGIKEIIDLLHHIPAEQDTLFGAEMIKRTLSSMKISITEILDDAMEKESVAQATRSRLKDEITDYLDRIDNLKAQIEHLNGELEDIQQAKINLTENDESLQSHISQTKGRKPAPPAPIQTKKKNKTKASTKDLPNNQEQPSQEQPSDANKALSSTSVASEENSPELESDRFDDENGLHAELGHVSIKKDNSTLEEGPTGFEGAESSEIIMPSLDDDAPAGVEIDALFEDSDYDQNEPMNEQAALGQTQAPVDEE